MKIYGGVQRSRRLKELERGAWVDNTLVLLNLDYRGIGELITSVEFGTVFEGPPMFSYGVVPILDSIALVENDYPFVTCGVSQWTILQDEEDELTDYYIGATLWINVAASSAYDMRFRLGFEGKAFKAFRANYG